MSLSKILTAVAITTGFALCTTNAQTLLLTGFGTGDFSDAGSSGFSQNTTSATFSGSDQSGAFLGTFEPVDVTALGSDTQLAITATISTANNTAFVIEIFDGTNFQGFTGFWSDFTLNTPTTVYLPMSNTVSAEFDYTQVQGIQIQFGGTGSTLTVSFDTLEIMTVPVPEPATFATFAGMAMLGMAVVRRRKVRAA